MAKRPIIRINYADWLEEYRKNEPTIGNDADIVELLTDSTYSTAEVGRMTIVAREQGHAADDILPLNKTMLAANARDRIAVKMQARRVTVEMPNGKEYTVREFVGISKSKADDEEEERAGAALDMEAITELQTEKTYVPFDTGAALSRAAHYLNNIVPGHIFERLKLIAAHSGDVLQASEQLKATIDEMVGRLV